ncbi:hypothetical protein ACFL2C_03975 [Patescibacteria group bacterium]
MKGLEFPVIGTKVKGLKGDFDINSPAGRAKYFKAKARDEIATVKRYMRRKTFIAFLIGKKSSGKGTYTKLFMEIFGEGKIAFVSVGDIIRDIHANWDKFEKSRDYKELQKLYRGYISFDEAVDALHGRSQTKLLPTEFILALLKLNIAKHKGKIVFVDGFLRDVDQVSYALFLRDLVDYRDDPDIFIMIDIAEKIIEERMKYRRICPVCQTSRNLKLLPTSKVSYDEKTREFYLECDNPTCKGAVMVPKEGDEHGLESIRERLDRDDELLKTAFGLHGVPKVLMRNHIPVTDANLFDPYEITPEFSFKKGKKGDIEVVEKPYVVLDDNGTKSHSLMAAPVVISMLKQLSDILR